MDVRWMFNRFLVTHPRSAEYRVMVWARLLVSSLTEKLIEGLKSPDASLMLPDLLSLSDPFGSSVEDMRDGSVPLTLHTVLSVVIKCICNAQ